MFLLLSLIISNLLFIGISTDTPFEPKAIAKTIPRDDKVNYRLPNNTHPVTYDLSIQTRVDEFDFDFSGHVNIGIVVDAQTREIVLHARQLTIVNVTLSRLRNNVPVQVVLLPFEYDVVPEFLKIRANRTVFNRNDRLTLDIHYVGTLRNDGGGFYRSSYWGDDGMVRWLASTKFEPTDARHAFPCYDEPAHKAKFTISITHGRGYSAISNMPEARIDNADDTVTTSFQETPLISSYLIAFVVSDFPYLTNSNETGVLPHRVYSRPSVIQSTRLALTNGPLVLQALAQYLQVNFSLPKMDQIAIPNFKSGAMENWGLVTYREPYLLYNETINTFNDELNVVTTIAHEFGHMWFGDLVSPRWWTYLWLNEGFANLFGYLGTDLVHPDWKIMEYFVTNVLQSVLRTDSGPSTHPMTIYVESPTEIASHFDSIAYSKSGSVIRMFLHALTENTFRKGLNYYLTKHSLQSADELDLFVSLNTAAREDRTLAYNLNVALLFASWSNQNGYPLLTVRRDYNTNVITLQQARYFGFTNPPNDNSKWWIPYNYATASDPNFNNTSPNGWLRNNETEKHISESLNTTDWILFNKQQTSYYRILYDDTNYHLLAKQLKSGNHSVIHVLNRAQLLDDLNEFVKMGRVNVDILLEFLSYLKEETEYAPWVPAQNALRRLNLLLAGVEKYHVFRSLVANLTEKFYLSVGVDDLPHDNLSKRLSRNIAINLACEFGQAYCLFGTHIKFREAIRFNVQLEYNVRSTLLNNGVRTASAEELKLLWKRLSEATTSNEVNLLAGCFGRVNNPVLLREYLHRTINDYENHIVFSTNGWRITLFRATCKNGQDGLNACIDLLQNRSAEVANAYKLDGLGGLVLGLADSIVTQATEDKLDSLLTHLKSANYIPEATAMAVKQTIKTNREWIDKRKSDVDGWLHSLENHNSIIDNNNTNNGNNIHNTASIALLSKYLGYFLIITLSFNYAKLY